MNTPLNCSVEGTDLVVRIGVGTLAWAAKKKNGGPIENRVRIADKTELAKDVANELMRQDELGNMPIAELLDDAIKAAADSGSVAFVYPRSAGRRGPGCADRNGETKSGAGSASAKLIDRRGEARGS